MTLLCCTHFTHTHTSHTIQYNSTQASLFHVFQQVFDAPRDSRYEEIRRLGVYIMRAFIEVAKTNPKVYAELFFYKSIREANDIEYGYDDQRYANGYCTQNNFNTNQTSHPTRCLHTYNIFYDQNGNLFSFPYFFFSVSPRALFYAAYNSASKKTGWTEEQEAELRQLFMENQNNPSTEKGNYCHCHIERLSNIK